MCVLQHFLPEQTPTSLSNLQDKIWTTQKWLIKVRADFQALQHLSSIQQEQNKRTKSYKICIIFVFSFQMEAIRISISNYGAIKILWK